MAEAWREYEEYIAEKLEEWGGGQAKVDFDQKLPGKLSGTTRQVDALVTGAFAGGVVPAATAAVDCKYYSSNVDVKDVEAFIGLVEDVETDFGLLITSVGFSPAAEERARRHRAIRLRRVPWVPVYVGLIEDLPRPYWPAHGEARYQGDYFDHSPYDAVGAFVAYHYVDASDYSFDPDVELDWMEDWLLSGVNDEVSWGDDQARHRVASALLEHRLDRSPTPRRRGLPPSAALERSYRQRDRL